MGFLLGIANKVGGVANKFAQNSGIVGKIASGVSKAANLVATVVPKAVPIVNKVMAVGKAAYESGLADKLTGGKVTRFVKGVSSLISPNRGTLYIANYITSGSTGWSNNWNWNISENNVNTHINFPAHIDLHSVTLDVRFHVRFQLSKSHITPLISTSPLILTFIA